MLSFHRQSDIDWEQPALADNATLSEDEQKIAQALAKRGASFAQALSGVLDGKPVLPVLLSLAEKGIVRSDSFFPVRQKASELSAGGFGGAGNASGSGANHPGRYGGAVDSGDGIRGGNNQSGMHNDSQGFGGRNPHLAGNYGDIGSANRYDNFRGNVSASQKARARLRAAGAGSTGGRWELARGLAQQPLEQAILRAFDRHTILCRETAQGFFSWPEALSVLRIWEYTGKVRRGYFVRGLSGAQFIRDDAYRQAVLALKTPREDIVWLSAADPCQCWGRMLPHMEGRSFVYIKSTAVALFKGVPVMVFEKNGQVLRSFDDSFAKDALFAFAAAFSQGRVFYGRSRVVVKQYPKELEQAMLGAGFLRQMLDYELFRRGSV